MDKNKSSRTSNSIKNTSASIISNAITILLGFFVQTVFIKTLGKEYLGINSLFSNIVSMLSVAELGIGSAIIYNLYEPIANGNKEKIKSLMQFYKRTYHIIAIVVFMIGILIIPFLNKIIGKTTIEYKEILIIYLLFISDATISYLLSYKRSIFYASQKNYYVLLIHIFSITLTDILQIILLLKTKNYYIFLIVKNIFRLLENIIITFLANRKYVYINEKCQKLDNDTKNDIVKKVKALFFHKIGTFVVSGTDNILISIYFGVGIVGLYSNYRLILSAIVTLIGQCFSNLNASIGNLLIENNKEKNYAIYRKINFLNFWISSFSSIAILCLMEDFIKIWVGTEYLLPFSVLVALCINNYWQTMRGTIAAFKEAAGIYYEDRFVPLIESLVNIIFSIIYIYIAGIAGVFIGTIISNFVLYLYSYPKLVYSKIFNKRYRDYMYEIFKYFFIALVTGFITYFIVKGVVINNEILKFLIDIIICLIIPNVIYVIIFNKTEEYEYFKKLLKKIKDKLIKRRKIL